MHINHPGCSCVHSERVPSHTWVGGGGDVMAGDGELERRENWIRVLTAASSLSKRQFQSNIIKAQQCNNCQLITENNKIHITVSLSQMPTSGANCDHAADPSLFKRGWRPICSHLPLVCEAALHERVKLSLTAITAEQKRSLHTEYNETYSKHAV